MLPEQHTKADFGAVTGTKGRKDTYTAKIPRTHPTIRPQNNWKERRGSGSDVPLPPPLSLPTTPQSKN